MYLFKQVKDLQVFIDKQREAGKKIGFVPTMGALHKGHLSLIERSKAQNGITVCSIFVNPTQFNDPKDLKKYPRTAANDIKLLSSAGNDVLFMPSVDEVYPKDLDTNLSLDFGQLANVMEGAFRPGHFDGMAQVVKRLLDIVVPDYLYMGQKDFQQFSIVQNMISQLKMPIKLVMCPIIREKDGLAMSSRNVRLHPDLRIEAIKLNQSLKKAHSEMGDKSPAEIKKAALASLQLPDFKPEYFEIVNGYTLQAVERFEEGVFTVACVAVWVGDIRLIDNMVFIPQ